MAEECENCGCKADPMGFRITCIVAMVRCEDQKHDDVQSLRSPVDQKSSLLTKASLSHFNANKNGFDREDFFDTQIDTRSIACSREAFETAKVQGSKAAKRMASVTEIRSKLKEYSK